MPKLSRPRHGSLQYWPRKRINKFIPSTNWNPVSSRANTESDCLLGFISYKVGMTSAVVKDNTDKSMTKGRRIAIPVTVLEVPNMRLYSIRFYKQGRVLKDIIVVNEKELKRKIKVTKNIAKEIKAPEEYDDIRAIVYTVVKQTGLKKSPDIAEIAVKAANKIEFLKNLIGKDIILSDLLKYDLVDVRGLTKGKGIQGPVKRFGIKLKRHKSEKGVRNPGSIGPWHPARVTFRVPMAGQLGMFTRTHYNLNVITSGNVKEKEKDINIPGGYKNYGRIKTNYIVVRGSVQGPQKRQLLVTPSFRPTRKTKKKKYELISLGGVK